VSSHAPRRSAAWVLLIGVWAVIVLPGCARGAAREDNVPSPDRARSLEFWDRFRAATARRGEGDLAGAVRLYRDALSLDPRHEDSLYYLGQCLRGVGEPVEARRAFEDLIGVNPASARGHSALGALLASPDPAEPFDLSRAEAHLRRAFEINGEETGPMVRLAEVLIVLGRTAEAGEWLEGVTRTNPRAVEAAFLAGYLAWESGEHGVARAFARKARAAARVAAPPAGVLGEGDRRAGHTVAPPLATPMGRTLFGEFASFLRSPAADGSPALEREFERAWRAVRGGRRRYGRRVLGAADGRARPRVIDREDDGAGIGP
jgi:tetratricopeptide (TPR) repeat protein